MAALEVGGHARHRADPTWSRPRRLVGLVLRRQLVPLPRTGRSCTCNLGPWVRGTGPVAGPGRHDFFRTADGELWLSSHAWDASRSHGAGGRRSMRIDRVVVQHSSPVLDGPTPTPAPFG